MAYYAYKGVKNLIPEHIIERLSKELEESGGEYDGDPNYDGDLWLAAKMYIEELLKRDALLAELEAAGVDNWDGYDFALEALDE